MATKTNPRSCLVIKYLLEVDRPVCVIGGVGLGVDWSLWAKMNLVWRAGLKSLFTMDTSPSSCAPSASACRLPLMV